MHKFDDIMSDLPESEEGIAEVKQNAKEWLSLWLKCVPPTCLLPKLWFWAGYRGKHWTLGLRTLLVKLIRVKLMGGPSKRN
jgi:hypothetical protein